ncbi:hypothetical protein [Bergeyella zoohelcum]|uniref:Uncharacterized protein n=1 Tax=Bergeyella zoohelcum TaxID=1015 RepID=A0A7Z8YRF6_9FLAO|nr:hypothetical protein [Bergeyella zoohelcum]VDH04587.1 Uncharacterised protein [Bergeyella zoohelcum]
MNKTTIKISVLAFLGFMTYGYAQQQQQDPYKGKVGVNTVTPSATMDVQPNSDNARVEAKTNEGIIAPKLSKTRIANIATPVEGTLVYATDETTSPISAYTGGDTKVAKITEKGYYFYNGTEWVKAGSDANDQLWAQRDNGGVIETYLKPADANGDQFYYSNKESVLNLGNVDLSELKEHSSTQPYIFDKETPHLLLINSSKFPETTTAYDKGARYYHFSREAFQVKNEHASSGTDAGDKRYLGKEFLAFAGDLTAKIAYLVGSNSHATFQSSSEAGQVVGGRFFTSIGTKFGGVSPKTNETIGVSSYPRIYGGEVKHVRGIVTSPLVYGGSIKDLRGVHTNVESMRQDENSLFPAANYTHIAGYGATLALRPNTTAVSTYGADITSTFHDQSTTTTGVGIMSRGVLNAGANVQSYSAYTAQLTAKNTATVGELYGFRLMTNLENTFAPTNMYGIHLADVNKGTASNYAIYTKAGVNSFGDRIEIRTVNDVDLQSDAAFMIGNKTGVNLALDNNELQSRNNGAVSLFAINPHGGDVFFNNQDADETKRFHFRSETGNVGIGVGNPSEKLDVAGNIKSSSLASNAGNRHVYADANGVLKIGTTDVTTLASLWTEDVTNNSIKLAVNSDGSTRSNTVSILDDGKVHASSFMGTNGATIFPDYVFQKYYTGTSSIKADYHFKSLSQVEDFVKTNGHLPGYKSAETIKAQGYVDLMETQLTNVEKIEELYLHLMEKEKEVKQLKEELKAQKEAFESRLERLEKLIQ